MTDAVASSLEAKPLSPNEPATGHGWRRNLLAVVLIAALGLGVVAWVLRSRARSAAIDPGEVATSGRIEARDVVLTPRAAARVLRVLVDEGDAVAVGQVVVETDDEVFRQQTDATSARVKALNAQLRAAEARLALTKRTAPLRVRQAAARLRAAEALEQEYKTSQAQALREHDRTSALVDRGSIPIQQGEIADLSNAQAEARTRVGASDVDRSRTELSLARVSVAEIAAAEAERDALRSQVAQAEAELSAQQKALDELTIKSPLAGVVSARNVEPGERVQPGTPLLTLVDPQRLTLKVYVSEPNVGRVVLGQPACVQVDAYPARVFPARVQRVAQRAEFTPKNVETREERVHLVFAIELGLSNPEGVLKPGMPADARIGCQPAPDSK
jgi:HlyD family secretion protein